MKKLTKKTINEGMDVTKVPFNASHLEINIKTKNVTITGYCSNHNCHIEMENHNCIYTDFKNYKVKIFEYKGIYSKKKFIDFIQEKYNEF